MNQSVTSEVFTLEEVANSFKLQLEAIEREASQENIPGRQSKTLA